MCWQSVLTEEVSVITGGVSVASCLKTLKKAKKDLFHKDDVPQAKDTSQVHAVCNHYFHECN